MYLLLLVLTAVTLEIETGTPGSVDYSPPPDFETEMLNSDSTWSVVDGENGVFTIVPLVLADTLELPSLSAWNNRGDTLLLAPPRVIVIHGFPDSLMSPSMPVIPCRMDIPPGLPEDYVHNLSFWLVWTASPPFPWIPVSAGAVLLGAAVWYLLHRRKKRASLEEQPFAETIPAGDAAEREALSLLDSESFIHGRWVELYTEIDRQYRNTVAGKFGVVNRALTLNQIAREVASTADGRRFLEESSELVREITLQIYADWGSTRDRSGVVIRNLARIRKEWSR